jgi:stage III sporulation protein SpoIIIAA
VKVEKESISHTLRSIQAILECDEDKIFSSDNRTGIPGTLHRISAIRNRNNVIIGLTIRIGRHNQGAAELILDILKRIEKE